MTPEEIALKEQAEKNIAEIAKKQAEETANELARKSMEEMTAKMNAEKEVNAKELAEQKEAFAKQMAEMQARIKKGEQTTMIEQNTFNQNLAEVIKNNADAIRGFKKGSPELAMTMKAVGNMNFAANFAGHTPFTQEVSQNIVMTPYNKVWLADVLPQGTANGNSIIYPVENGGEGAAAVWTDTTADKAQLDFDLTSKSAFFKWIAGWVVVDRDMLDDIDWLSSYLQNKMLISLKTAENAFILNGTADTNPVEGILDKATSYNGLETKAVETILDAAYGQIVETTNDMYNPTNVVLNPRDMVAVGLNKATGSGEFDLPAGSVAFGNGQLAIGGLNTVATTGITKKSFLTLDRNAVMFIRRMNPEIRMFEDAALAKKNKVMFRIEERVTQVIFNKAALVKGTFL